MAGHGGSNRVVYHPPKWKKEKKEKKKRKLISEENKHRVLNVAHASHMAQLLLRRH